MGSLNHGPFLSRLQATVVIGPLPRSKRFSRSKSVKEASLQCRMPLYEYEKDREVNWATLAGLHCNSLQLKKIVRADSEVMDAMPPIPTSHVWVRTRLAPVVIGRKAVPL